MRRLSPPLPRRHARTISRFRFVPVNPGDELVRCPHCLDTLLRWVQFAEGMAWFCPLCGCGWWPSGVSAGMGSFCPGVAPRSEARSLVNAL